MGFVVEKVKQLACESCGGELDIAAAQPLTHIVCPDCGQEQRVPAQFDNYLVYELLGKGTFGFVFRGKDKGLGRDFAIKIFSSKHKDADEVAENALAEAKALAKLNHHNVVRVHTMGEHQGVRYIVMELLAGGSAKRYTEPGAQPGELDAVVLGMCVAKGLRMAQRVGLIHMDVKPGNMLYDAEGHPKLIDFGMSAHAKPGGEYGVVGTPYYIAPETALGREPDFRADMYSLGASIFHIMAGRPPFDDPDTRTTIGLRLKHDAPLISAFRKDVHPKTVDLIARMLKREPDDRYASYDELIEAFDAAKMQIEFGLDDESAPPVNESASDLTVPAVIEAPLPEEVPAASNRSRASTATMMWVAFVGLLVVGAVVLLLVVAVGSDSDSASKGSATTTPPDASSPTTSTNSNVTSPSSDPSPSPVAVTPVAPAPPVVVPPVEIDIPGLVAHWTFDAGGGTSVVDVLGHVKPGFFLGKADWLKPGHVGAATGRFDGKSYVAFDDAMPRGAYTKAAWVHRYHGDFEHPVLCGSTGHALMLSHLNGFRPSAGHNGNWRHVEGKQPIPPFRWQHVAVSFDPDTDDGTMTLYHNGEQVARATGVPAPNPETEMFIGTLGRAVRFKGLIDDVRLYDRALTADEVSQLASTGNPADIAPIAAP